MVALYEFYIRYIAAQGCDVQMTPTPMLNITTPTAACDDFSRVFTAYASSTTLSLQFKYHTTTATTS
jgi:hypothetical protein